VAGLPRRGVLSGSVTVSVFVLCAPYPDLGCVFVASLRGVLYRDVAQCRAVSSPSCLAFPPVSLGMFVVLFSLFLACSAGSDKVNRILV